MKKDLNTTSRKKGFILGIVSLILLVISILLFVIDAMTIKNVIIAWIIVGIMAVSIIGIIVGIIIGINDNKDRIKAYYEKILNRR